jgi:hypothetical protein
LNLKQWCDLDEIIYSSQTDEEYKQYAGLDFKKEIIEQLAEMKIINSKIFIDFFSHPRPVLLGAIEDIAYSKTKKLELELHNMRNDKVSSSKYKFNSSPVNWSTWRQFNSHEKEPTKRKELFDEFIVKTKYIAPIVEKRFLSIKQIYEEYDVSKSEIKGINNTKLDPVSAYLEQENISYEKLIEFIKSMGQRAKKPFKDALTDVGKTILGKEPEYYDDFYLFRNKIYSDIDGNFSSIDPVIEVQKTLTAMEFDLSKIHFDTEDRRNKYPSPICFFVSIPNDIRILYKKESPYFDLQACFHETGHAMHEYWKENLSIYQACELYSRLIKEYTGFEIPGEYWLLHHILPESIMYVPSYLLAAVRAAELNTYMKERFGDKWWKEKQSGRNLREVMGPGASIDLSIFSTLDSRIFLNEITQ